MKKKLYFCNPIKNYMCNKRHCAYLHDNGECRLTSHEEFKQNDDFELLQRIKSGKGLKPLFNENLS